MRITRCPRCRAEDISSDAHPTRLLQNGRSAPVLVCRGCYRAAELEYRIACQTNGLAYETLPIREGLALLRDFYLDRLGEWRDPDLLIEDDERASNLARITDALGEVERRLAIAPV